MLNPDFWTQTVSGILGDIMAWLPSLVGAVLLIIAGVVIGRLIQAFLGGLLRRVGLDRAASRAGATEVLTDAGLDPSVSYLVARLVYWVILLVFVLAAAESLGLQGVADMISGLVAYLPSVLAAALILLLGGLIARLIGDAVGALAIQTGIQAGPVMGQAVRYVLLIFVIILALEQLGVETTLLTTATIALVGATALALAVAFGLGSRELARNIMAGFHAKEEFTIGQTLSVRGHTGRLVSVTSVKTIIETEDGHVSLPNSALTDEEVTIVSDSEEA
ncbi:MAG: Small-conductance mechanosensitive channel [Anaerolineales bacterium]|nr:Small-conductance mechanosensitive channel [Anaerolineales bacterium]